MKKLLCLSFIACCILSATSLFAQKVNQKMGKPSEEEWALTQWEGAPDAEAIVLYKSMTATYTLSRAFSSYSGQSEILSSSNIANMGINHVDYGGTTVNYDCRLRTKILKDSGREYANVDILYYTYAKDAMKESDLFESLKVTVFSKNEKGKVVKNQLNAKSFEQEVVNDYYSVIHVKVPDVKAGDIIEYRYQITSNRVSFLYDWSFQENIPVLYSKCDLDIPAPLQFNMNVPIDPCIKSNVEKGVVRLESTSGDMQAAKTYPTNHYIIEGRDIAPRTLDSDSKKISNVCALIKNTDVARRPAPQPSGKSHLVIKP